MSTSVGNKNYFFFLFSSVMDATPNDIFELCLTNPRLVYNRNVYCSQMVKEDNAFVDDCVYYPQQCYNLILRNCTKMPPCMAVLILFWLAKIHTGVRLAIIDSMQNGSRKHTLAFCNEFLTFTDTVINNINTRDINDRCMPKRSLYFYALFVFVEQYKLMPLMKSVAVWTKGKIEKPEKKALLAARRKRCAEKGIDIGIIKLTEPDDVKTQY